MDDLISRQDAIDFISAGHLCNPNEPRWSDKEVVNFLKSRPSAQPQQVTGKLDLISRQAVMDALWVKYCNRPLDSDRYLIKDIRDIINSLPSAQSEQRYTEEELRVFQHGISLSLLSKRSSQHWQYDEDTATEIKFLERLYEKVGADMRGEQDG